MAEHSPCVCGCPIGSHDYSVHRCNTCLRRAEKEGSVDAVNRSCWRYRPIVPGVTIAEYTVRVVAPERQLTALEIGTAIHTLIANLEHHGYNPDRMNIEHLLDRAFVDGVDSLGEKGFVVRVERKTHE